MKEDRVEDHGGISVFSGTIALKEGGYKYALRIVLSGPGFPVQLRV